MQNPHFAETKTSKTPQRKRWLRRAGLVLCALLFVCVADYFWYPRYAPIGGRSFNTGRNGTWLKDDWYLGKATQTPERLAGDLTAHQMGYAYFHVRFIKKDGTLRFHTDPHKMRELLSRVRDRAPNTKLIAWVYVGNARGITGVDLREQTMRAAMVREAQWLVDECGFDGVQWDYEICENNNPAFLALLDETRRALPKSTLLCACSALWLPDPLLPNWGWSEDYFAQVAARCDQIAVMGYDSGLYLPRSYVWLMHEQAVRVCRAVYKGNSSCRVLIGVPTYEDGGPSHHAYAENIALALKGVREGLTSPGADTNSFEGVAIFGDYTTDEKEWETYARLWLRQ